MYYAGENFEIVQLITVVLKVGLLILNNNSFTFRFAHNNVIKIKEISR